MRNLYDNNNFQIEEEYGGTQLGSPLAIYKRLPRHLVGNAVSRILRLVLYSITFSIRSEQIIQMAWICYSQAIQLLQSRNINQEAEFRSWINHGLLCSYA